MTIANTLPILAAVTIATWLGDYFIKTATLSPDGLRHPNFAIGSVLYGLTAIGWYYLMKSHSLVMVAVIFTAMTIIVLGAMGYLLFDEGFGKREALGVTFAALALATMYKG